VQAVYLRGAARGKRLELARLFQSKKAAPLLGPRFKEVKSGRFSGKAKEVAVSPGEAALREMVTGDEVEGHF
jgi:hypothetical protein